MADWDHLKHHLHSEIARGEDDLLALARDLVCFNTENPPGRSRPITEFIAGYLAQRGIAATLHEAPGGHCNLTADIKGGRAGRRLLFCGHTDVVPVGDAAKWEFDPFAGDLVDGFVRGRGTSDMKAGLAAFLRAAVLLNEVRAALPGSVGLVIADDEETGGLSGTDWLLEGGHVRGDACIIAEPSEPLHPTIGQKGSCWFEVTFTGQSAHGALAPLAGHNAILQAGAAALHLTQLYSTPVVIPPDIRETIAVTKAHLQEVGRGHLADLLDHVSVNIGVIRGGSKTNIVPDVCTIEIDTRVPFGLGPRDVLGAAEQLLAALGCSFSIRPLAFQSEPNYTSPDDPIVQAVLGAVREVRGGAPYGVLQWASSDARHFRRRDIPVLQYGPGELETVHASNERVRVTDVVACAKVYALAALEYLGAS